MRSSAISMKTSPPFDEVKKAIELGFSFFKKKIPTVTNRPYGVSSNSDPYVEGEHENEWAWISIYEWPSGQDGNDDCPFICEVLSRGDDLFAAIVCYSLFKAFGQKFCDDAGYLMAGHEFTTDELENALHARLAE